MNEEGKLLWLYHVQKKSRINGTWTAQEV